MNNQHYIIDWLKIQPLVVTKEEKSCSCGELQASLDASGFFSKKPRDKLWHPCKKKPQNRKQWLLCWHTSWKPSCLWRKQASIVSSPLVAATFEDHKPPEPPITSLPGHSRLWAHVFGLSKKQSCWNGQSLPGSCESKLTILRTIRFCFCQKAFSGAHHICCSQDVP